MSYTLHQLRLFEAVVRNESITRAAKELHMTQPAVSIQLKQLQDHFELNLFEIVSRKFYLTSAGEDLYQRLIDLNKTLDDIEDTMAEHRGTLKGNLHFSVVSTGKYFMPHFLGLYKEAYPGINLKLQVTNRFTVFEHLKKNMTDFVVVSIVPESPPVESLEIMDNPLVVASRPDYGISGSISDFRDLADQSFILREKGSGTRLVMLDLFREYDIDPPITFELGTNEAIKQAIMAGFGLSVLSRFSMKSELKSGEIKQLNIQNFPITTHWQLIWLKGKRMNPAARKFLDFVKSRKDKIIEENFSWVYD